MVDVDPIAARDALALDATFTAYIPDGSDASGTPLYTTRQWRGSDVALPERESILALATDRAQRVRSLREEAKSKRRRKVTESETKTARDQISRDAKGRPRVSLHYAHIGRDSLLLEAEAKVLVDQTILSSRREYVLVESRKELVVDLPWQPLVGALCVISSQMKITKNVLDRFVQWKTLGTPTPVLFILALAGPERDERAVLARALLDEAGFIADEAAVLCAEKLDEESVAALACTLDEVVTIEGAREEAVSDLRERAVAMLESTVQERRVDAYKSALTLVRKHARGMTAAMKASAVKCAMEALSHEPARRAAIGLIQALPPAEDVAPMRALWLELLSESRTVPVLANTLLDELVRANDTQCFDALVELLRKERNPSTRSEAWLSAFDRCTVRTPAEPLKTWVDTLVDKDPRKAAATTAVARLQGMPPLREKKR